MIGDPSGRSSERQMMSSEKLSRNIEGISRDIRKFLAFDQQQNFSVQHTFAVFVHL